MDRIGKYEIQAQIGHGGFGRVYRAFDPTVGRTVAIKVMLGSGGETDHELLRRFRVEASATGGLRHKNIVTIFDYGEHEGTPYLVIEYLEGRDLYKIISDGPPLSLLDMVTIMDQVAEGLQHAHQSGVVHRDVKPANIMILNDGSVKIMDFGIARVKREQETRITQQGYLIGTVAYMAPEQFWGGEVDHRTDIFAYGVILFELIAGRHPFRPPKAESGQVMFNIANIHPPLVSSIVSGIPPELDQLIVRAIQKDRDTRYLTLEDLRFDLAPILQELKGRFVQDKVQQARGLFTGGHFDQAQELIREVLRQDASNTTARQLREEIQKLTRNKVSREKSNQLAEAAREQLSAGEYSKAAENFEEALKLDSTNTWIAPLLAQAKAAVAKAHRTVALMAAARRQLESDDLSGARRIITECLENEPHHEEAGSLLRIILEKREKRIEDTLSRAKALAVGGSYDEALSLLEKLAALYPDAANIPRIADRLRTRRQHDLAQKQSREPEPERRPAPPPYRTYTLGGIGAGLLLAIGLYFGLSREVGAPKVVQVVKNPPPPPLAPKADPARLHVSTNFEAGKIMMDGSVQGVLEHGEFAMEELPPGKHTLEISAADGAQARIKFESNPASLPTVLSAVEVKQVAVLTLSRFGRQAQIMSDGKARAVSLDGREVGPLGAAPIALEHFPDTARELKMGDGPRTLGFPITPQNKPALQIFLRANRAANGTFQTSLPPGDYQVLVEKPASNPAQLQEARIARDSVRQVGLRLEPKPAERIVAETVTAPPVPEPKPVKTAPEAAPVEVKKIEPPQNLPDLAAIESLEWEKARTSKEAIEAFFVKYPRSTRREAADKILAQWEKERLDQREKTDTQSLLQTLQQLSAAYASKDAKEISRLYPSVSKQFLNGLKKDIQSVTLQLRIVGSPQMTHDVATAQVERQVATLFKGESKARTESDRVTITLRRANTTWIIESIR